MARGYQCDKCKEWFVGKPPETSVNFEPAPLMPRQDGEIQAWGRLAISLTDYDRHCDWCQLCVRSFWQQIIDLFLQKGAQHGN